MLNIFISFTLIESKYKRLPAINSTKLSKWWKSNMLYSKSNVIAQKNSQLDKFAHM